MLSRKLSPEQGGPERPSSLVFRQCTRRMRRKYWKREMGKRRRGKRNFYNSQLVSNETFRVIAISVWIKELPWYPVRIGTLGIYYFKFPLTYCARKILIQTRTRCILDVECCVRIKALHYNSFYWFCNRSSKRKFYPSRCKRIFPK